MKQQWTGERLETGIHSQVTAEHLHRYALAMELAKDKNTLDIACGEGYGSYLLSATARSVTGIDINEQVINAAKEKYRKTNLSFLSGDAQLIRLQSHSMDVVVSFETLEHLKDHAGFLSEIKRVLVPGGILIMSTPDKKWYSDQPGYTNPFHEKELYKEEFEELIRSRFINVTILQQLFISGSVVLPAESGRIHEFYSGDFDSISKKSTSEAPYLIAIASDSNLPSTQLSIFNAGNIMEQAVRDKESDIRNSLSYRIGNYLLAPAKWIKNILKKA